jgi:hypothetical protein
LLDVLDQGISVRWLAAQRFENHHLQGAGEQIARRIFLVFHKAILDHA